MRWVATRSETVLAKASLTDLQRAELRIRRQTMLMLAGQATRSYKMPAANFSDLDTAPESASMRELELEGLTVRISLGDAPQLRETLLINRLWDYRGTPLQLLLAKSLEKRAAVEPKFMTGTGWIEVALVLLGVGVSTALNTDYFSSMKTRGDHFVVDFLASQLRCRLN